MGTRLRPLGCCGRRGGDVGVVNWLRVRLAEDGEGGAHGDVPEEGGVFLFAPPLYVAAMLLYMGSIPLDIAHPLLGSVYRSPQRYARLRADMDADNSTDAVSDSS
ncbi:hypothetical protein GUJ93_ZPchr0337g7089 [Zizania palustris]|uniref:Uncharacterized protein n=1 Tax=Zizania palustris TaxID=103762 RepID=A0A8J5RIL8_ZIZPA|nr:hypothetical protein GUJ93_ZPchr0337g7089 [Zizania palustris]